MSPRPTVIHVRARPGHKTRGILTCGTLTIPCILGRSGITRFKREGDGATPAGRMRLLAVRFRADRRGLGPTSLPSRIIRSDDAWIDAADDGRYNRPARLPCAVSHEVMTRDDRLYDRVIILDWNFTRRSLGRGSAIFLHQTRPDGGPTAGCVAVEPRHMALLLARIGRSALLVIA